MFFRERRRRQEEEADRRAKLDRFHDLLTRAEAEDEEAQNQLVREGWYDDVNSQIQGRIDAIKKAVEARNHRAAVRYEYEAHSSGLASCQARWLEAKGSDSEILALNDLLTSYKRVRFKENLSRFRSEIGISKQEASAILDSLVTSKYETLVAGADDFLIFQELLDFIRLTREGGEYTDTKGKHYQSWHRPGIQISTRLEYPAEWNDLSARHYDTPSIGIFVRQPERGPGDVRLLAAEALRTDSFTDAQIALAYCNNDAKYRAAVGDVLTAELAKLVMQHRAEMAKEAPASAE